MSKIAVMAFSGGMDSTGLLVHLLASDYEVHTLSYNYGQKHKLELDRAKANIAYLSENNIQVSELNKGTKLLSILLRMYLNPKRLIPIKFDIVIANKAVIIHKKIPRYDCFNSLISINNTIYYYT